MLLQHQDGAGAAAHVPSSCGRLNSYKGRQSARPSPLRKHTGSLGCQWGVLLSELMA